MDPRFDTLKLQFEALRGESLAKMKFGHEVRYYKWLAVGAISSVLVLGRSDGKRPGFEFLLLVTGSFVSGYL
jgi:hypothetical protein